MIAPGYKNRFWMALWSTTTSESFFLY